MLMLPGAEFFRLWGGDVAPTFPDDGSPPAQPMYFPPVGGYRFGIFTMPPGGDEPPIDLNPDAGMAEVESKLPGLLAHMESSEPGMHRTDTIDFGIVLSGEVTLELDDGAQTTLHAGDTIVQNGTRHRWTNPGASSAVIAVFTVGAHRA